MGAAVGQTWTKSRWKVAAALALAALVVAGLGLYAAWLESGGVFRTRDFDRATWLSVGKDLRYAGGECSPAAGMAYDIKTRLIRPGVSRDEVLHLLGGQPVPGRVITYSLGICRKGTFQALAIHFDERDRVRSVEIE